MVLWIEYIFTWTVSECKNGQGLICIPKTLKLKKLWPLEDWVSVFQTGATALSPAANRCIDLYTDNEQLVFESTKKNLWNVTELLYKSLKVIKSQWGGRKDMMLISSWDILCIVIKEFPLSDTSARWRHCWYYIRKSVYIPYKYIDIQNISKYLKRCKKKERFYFRKRLISVRGNCTVPCWTNRFLSVYESTPEPSGKVGLRLMIRLPLARKRSQVITGFLARSRFLKLVGKRREIPNEIKRRRKIVMRRAKL